MEYIINECICNIQSMSVYVRCVPYIWNACHIYSSTNVFVEYILNNMYMCMGNTYVCVCKYHVDRCVQGGEDPYDPLSL